MKLARLRRTGIPELACRGRQAASKWLERLGAARRPTGSFGALSVGRFQEAAPARFFEGAESPEVPALLCGDFPAARDEILATAQAIRQKRFDLLGYRGLSFGDPLDWHLDPVSGRRAPFVHWSRIDALDAALVGDSKVVWELNRQQWLVRLGQAHRLTGDERYAPAFAGYIHEWMRANPPGMGINWASSLEVALRLISWCWALVLFRRSAALSPELFAEMVESISTHASHVERYLSHYFSPNTHLTGEALGLFYAGILFPELRAAGRWRALGARILVEQSERQLLPDGVYFEQSTCYQRYTIETYLHLLVLAARNRVEIPAAVSERVQRMLDFLVAIRGPDGSVPQIGDGDGGWLLPLARRAPGDPRGVFSTAAALFSRSDYAWAAESLAPETLWLLGPAGREAFERLRPAPPAGPPSRLFAQGGHAVMRNGWDANAHQLSFDVGPLGCPVSGGHGHADLLSIECSVWGVPYLVDPGTYCYTADARWRDFFRSTAAHSTVRVDGLEQAIPAGPFTWKNRPRAWLRSWVSTEAFDLADAEHDAYRRLADPVVHRRRVLFVKPRYWVLVDDLEGAAEHHVEVRFQFAPAEVVVEADLWARARGPDGRGLLIRAYAPVPLKAEVREGEVDLPQGWVSPDYGQRRPAPTLIYWAATRLPLRVLTLLLPFERMEAVPPPVSLLLEEGGAPAGLVLEGGRERITVTDREVLLERR